MFETVLSYFKEIAKIPHGSGNMGPICDYCVEFAKNNKLEYYRDSANNILIKKPATKGRENAPTIILQGHLDMVCDMEPNATYDPELYGVEIIKEGDFLKANKTTLGADNGIAIAYSLAILSSDNIEHPAIEALFTTDEEIGMIGATALDASPLIGHTLINIDSEEEGVFTVACAGGLRADFVFHIQRTMHTGSSYRLSVKGLLGGHSGAEIDKGRANAYKLLGELLKNINSQTPLMIKEIGGGGKDNAIAKYAFADIVIENGSYQLISDIANEFITKINSVYQNCDPNITFAIEKGVSSLPAISNERSVEIISALTEMPSGIIKMSETFPGFVDTSLNLGVIKTENDSIKFTFSMRSFSNDARDELLEDLVKITKKYNGIHSTHGKYPAWPFKDNSHLRDVMTDCYKNMFNKDAVVCPIHAGLECGVLSTKIKDLDCISFGPNLYDVHTPRERLELSSAKRMWKFLLEILKEI